MTREEREMDLWVHAFCAVKFDNIANANGAVKAFREVFPLACMPEARGPDKPLVDYSKIIGGPGQTTPYLACRSNT